VKIGYIRTSTIDQNLDLQKDALKKEGCEKIFIDQLSGSLSKAQRPNLKDAINYAREDDVIVVWRLDRLGRSIKDLIEIVNELNSKKIGIKSLNEQIDTSTANGKLIFHIFASIAEFERELIKERTKAGLKSARARGRIGGRPSKITSEKIRMAKQLHSDPNNPIEDILKMLNIGRATFYKMLKLSKH
jgi:DNA invertase Pin-like site-specific DNA recombinase